MAQTPVLTTVDKIAKAKELKTLGNTSFQVNDFQAALRHYHSATLYISGLDTNLQSIVPQPTMEKEVKLEISSTLASLYLNLSACHLKMKNYPKTIFYADKTIVVNPDLAKAYFRRGQANIQLNNLDKAAVDLKKAIELAPQDAGIRQTYQDLRDMFKKLGDKQKTEMAGLFDRM